MKRICLLLVVVILAFGCNKGDGSDQGMPEKSKYGDKARKFNGEPDYPPLDKSWVIDKANVVADDVEKKADSVFQAMQDDGVAEVVILVINGVTKPGDYATQYGRFLKLGKAGPASQGGSNGIVWLIRPDAKDKMTISVGRGLPKFTSQDYGEIMDEVADYCQSSNYDKCVSSLAVKTDEVIRRVKK